MKKINRHVLALLLLIAQAATLSAVKKPNGPMRGRMGQGGRQERIEQFDTAIKGFDVESFKKHLADYRGGKLGLFALVGKLSMAVDENHENGSIDQGEKATRTRHLHEMRDAVYEKLKAHPGKEAGQRKPRSQKMAGAEGGQKEGRAQRAGRPKGQGMGGRRAAAAKKLAATKATTAGE